MPTDYRAQIADMTAEPPLIYCDRCGRRLDPKKKPFKLIIEDTNAFYEHYGELPVRKVGRFCPKCESFYERANADLMVEYMCNPTPEYEKTRRCEMENLDILTTLEEIQSYLRVKDKLGPEWKTINCVKKFFNKKEKCNVPVGKRNDEACNVCLSKWLKEEIK